MLSIIPRISICIISYNQEELISRAIESLVSQRHFLYEICINDDCSTDNTFNVLLEYQQKYPDLIKPFRNEHNLGIFENIESSWSLPSGDIVYMMAGDDEAGKNYFQFILEFIKKNNIDWENELFCIYGDYKEIEPDGKSIVYKNSLVKSHDALKLKIRNLLCNRSACYSKRVLDKFERVSEGRSFSAESVQDGQLALFAEKNYYIPIVGNIYYAGIGISSRMNQEERNDNIYRGYQRFSSFVEQHGHPFDQKDLAFVEYMKAYRSHDLKKAILYYLKSIDFSLGWRGLNLDRILYVLRKKHRLF